MAYIKFLFFLALAVACVLAYPADTPQGQQERAKKQVLLGSYGGYAASPLAYSAPLAYSGGYIPSWTGGAYVPSPYGLYY